MGPTLSLRCVRATALDDPPQCHLRAALAVAFANGLACGVHARGETATAERRPRLDEHAPFVVLGDELASGGGAVQTGVEGQLVDERTRLVGGGGGGIRA